jgi:hypothetical protein
MPADGRLRETVSTLQHLSTEHIANLERARNAILQLETNSKTAWGVSARFPEDENLRAHATNLDTTLDELRKTVRESELVVKASLETLKASFDSIRDTRR